MNIALITNGYFVTPKTEEIRGLLIDAFERKGVKPVNLRNDDCLAGTLRKVNELDFSTVLFWDKDILLARKLELIGKKVINSSEALKTCDDKGLTAITASAAGIAMPTTLVAPFTYANIGYNNFDFLEHVVAKIDFPMVVKESHGSFGQQVYLARNYDELKSIVSSIAPKPMIFQQYIECGNSDLRLQVIGDEVVAAVKRTSLNGDFRANATLGGKMTAYTPTKEECELAVRAAKAVGAEIAGVDILQGDKPYLCEVNANAHFKRLMDATGIDVAGKIADYVLSKI